jgi:hypothetical protein
LPNFAVSAAIAVSMAREGRRPSPLMVSPGVISVFYDVSGSTVEILAVVVKSESDSWLAQFGNPE